MAKWKSISPTENEEAIALVQWVKTKPLIREYFIHIPNEGKRSFYSGALMKKMGLVSGVCDYFLAFPIGKYHGLWIELKRNKKSSVSNSQKEWIERMRLLDYQAYIAYGFDEAVNIITLYLKQGL